MAWLSNSIADASHPQVSKEKLGLFLVVSPVRRRFPDNRQFDHWPIPAEVSNSCLFTNCPEPWSNGHSHRMVSTLSSRILEQRCWGIYNCLAFLLPLLRHIFTTVTIWNCASSCFYLCLELQLLNWLNYFQPHNILQPHFQPPLPHFRTQNYSFPIKKLSFLAVAFTLFKLRYIIISVNGPGGEQF